MTTQITLHPGDNRESLRRLIAQGVRVHSVVTDPPYGLHSITKRFGNSPRSEATENGETPFGRTGRGFMGSKWDGSCIERDPEFWALIYEILLPGGYLIAFSSSRTYHHMATPIESVGFITHPFLGWVFGQGFPKAHNAAKAIDRELGVEPIVVETVKRRDIRNGQGEEWGANAMSAAMREGGPQYIDHAVTKPGSPEAQAWDGWAYGAQALKPAMEPIYVGQKPFSEKNGALNLLKHGVGAMNIDGCRVAATGDNLGGGAYQGYQRDGGWQNDDRTDGKGSGFKNGGAGDFVQPTGRHPANLLHDSSDDVTALFPNDAARFFNCFPPDGDPIFYHSKASKADRAGSKHPTVKPVALMQWLCRLVTPPGGTILDPFGGSGTTAEAARREGFDCILMEAEDQFVADIRRRFDLLDPLDPLLRMLDTPADEFADILG